MKLIERNRKVAISRWEKRCEFEKLFFDNSKNKLYLKARICGYLAGDGSVQIRKENSTSGHYGIRFFPDHESLIDYYIVAFKEIYKKIPLIKTRKEYYVVECFSKGVVEDLISTADFGIMKWRAPMQILINKRTKAEWLRAIFDSEGYVGNDHIKIYNSS